MRLQRDYKMVRFHGTSKQKCAQCGGEAHWRFTKGNSMLYFCSVRCFKKWRDSLLTLMKEGNVCKTQWLD